MTIFPKHIGAIAVASLFAASAAQAQSVPGQGTWTSTLQARDLDGNAGNGAEAFYDTTLNITWLKNANTGVGSIYDIDGSGAMTWEQAQSFTAGLNIGGVTGWRQPTVAPINGVAFQYYSPLDYWTGTRDQGYNITSPNSELAHMFHVTLGNKSIVDTNNVDVPDFGVTNMAGFEGLSSANAYWFGTTFDQHAGDPRYEPAAWLFYPAFGSQGFAHNDSSLLVWAVHDGDVGAALPVPEPESWALMLAGLAGIAAFGRRRARRQLSA